MIYHITRPYNRIPIFNYLFIHLFNRSKRSPKSGN